MSSRVQKGGQKFKPIVKARAYSTEGSQNVPTRKPLSVRESTAEPPRTPSEKLNTQAIEYTHHSIAPSAADLFGSEQHNDSASYQKPSRPTTSRRVGSGGVAVHDGARDTSVSLDVTNDVTICTFGEVRRIPDVCDVTSREAPSISDSQGSQTEAPSSIPSVTHQTAQVPATSGIQATHPNLVQDRSQGADVRSQAESTVQERVPSPEWNQQVIQQGPESSGTHEEEISSRSERRTRRRARGSDEENAVPTDERENIVKSTTKKKRRSPRNSSTTAGHTEVHTGMQDSTDQALRRSTRRRRSSTAQSELHNPSESVLDVHESPSDVENRQKRRRGSSTVSSITRIRGRRSRNMVTLDPDAEPGDELDPTVVTMAAICDDTGQGRVSSRAAIIQRNHLAWKLANKQKRQTMRLNMEAKKYGKKVGEGTSQESVSKPDEELPDTSEPQVQEEAGTAPIEGASGSGFNYKEALAVNRFTAQVRIGPNGETIIDEDSLFVDRADHADGANETYQHVEESDQTKFTNSASYARRPRSSRWSAEETELFYDALSQFGENYELISYVLPGRDRKAVKAKFKAEDKKNPGRIAYCLNNRIPYDMQTLSRLTGKDFSGPLPEIRAPEPPPATEAPTDVPSETEWRSEPEGDAQQPCKRSKPPAMSDDVEVVGDVETFESDV